MKAESLVWVENHLCGLVGCTSWFAKHSSWPHRYVCVPIARALDKKDEAA